MELIKININLNEHVKFKLTDYGKDICPACAKAFEKFVEEHKKKEE